MTQSYNHFGKTHLCQLFKAGFNIAVFTVLRLPGGGPNILVYWQVTIDNGI